MSSDTLFRGFEGAWNFQLIRVENEAITLGSIIVGLLALIVGISFSKYLSRKTVRFFAKRFHLEKNVSSAIQALSFYILAAFTSLSALKFAHIPLTIFTVIGGALAIGVGFGSQNLVNNFISGIILMVERPVKVGDFIEVDGVFGEVERIGMRCANIHTYGNRHIIVPNSSFLEKNVLNWTRLNSLIRISVAVGVAYGSPTKKVQELLAKAAESEPSALKNPKPLVFFTNFGDSALEFRVDFWIDLKSLDDRQRAESEMRFRIDELFRANGVVIAFPQRDIHFYSERPIPVEVRSSNAPLGRG